MRRRRRNSAWKDREIIDEIMSNIAHTAELSAQGLRNEAEQHLAHADAITDALAHGDIKRLVKFGVVSNRDVSDLRRMGAW